MADERKDQFLAMLAHELCNPLAPIRATAGIEALAPSDVDRVANLLNNAVKYTLDGGRIRGDAEAMVDWVLMTVSDNGIGMSPEVARSAFDLFAQGGRTPDRAQGGLGIG